MDDLSARGISGRLDSGPTSRPARRLVPLQTRHPRRMFARFRGNGRTRSRKSPTTGSRDGVAATCRCPRGGRRLSTFRVRLEIQTVPTSRDCYGRLLAYVFRQSDNLLVNKEIIRQGYGHTYTKYAFEPARRRAAGQPRLRQHGGAGQSLRRTGGRAPGDFFRLPPKARQGRAGGIATR